MQRTRSARKLPQVGFLQTLAHSISAPTWATIFAIICHGVSSFRYGRRTKDNGMCGHAQYHTVCIKPYEAD
eukprot:1653458-Amphidinium_carterae.5